MTDINHYADGLALSEILRAPALRLAIQALHLPPGSRGLDAGCGIGLHTGLLAEVVGPQGHVTGLDLSPEFLVLAREHTNTFISPKQISFKEGNLNNLPFDDNTFDWVWSVDALYPGALDPLTVLNEFVRVVKPGGSIAILFWSAQKLLPGYPLLEARLDAAFAETSSYTRGIRPSLHFLCALGWLRQVGLEEVTARTFVADVHAPLSADVRRALIMTFQMFWGEVQAHVAPGDWAEFERLCRSESPDCILDRRDYYAFLTYSLFRGTVPQ